MMTLATATASNPYPTNQSIRHKSYRVAGRAIIAHRFTNGRVHAASPGKPAPLSLINPPVYFPENVDGFYNLICITVAGPIAQRLHMPPPYDSPIKDMLDLSDIFEVIGKEKHVDLLASAKRRVSKQLLVDTRLLTTLAGLLSEYDSINE